MKIKQTLKFLLLFAITLFFNSKPVISQNCEPCIYDAATCNITVCFTGVHTYISDLTQWHLVHSSGLDFTLWCDNSCVGRVCNSGDDFTNLCFTTAIGAPALDICSIATPATGTFATNQSLETILNGLDVKSGTWCAQVYDCVGGDVGTLQNVTLTITCSNCNGGAPISYSNSPNAPIGDNSCTASTAAKATIGNASVATRDTCLQMCSTNMGGSTAIFDLTAANTVGPSGCTKTYFTSASDAIDSVGQISNPSTYTGVDNQTIYVRVNCTTGCPGIAKIKLEVCSKPGLAQAQNVAICSGNTATLNVSPVDPNLSYEWYATAADAIAAMAITNPATVPAGRLAVGTSFTTAVLNNGGSNCILEDFFVVSKRTCAALCGSGPMMGDGSSLDCRAFPYRVDVTVSPLPVANCVNKQLTCQYDIRGVLNLGVILGAGSTPGGSFSLLSQSNGASGGTIMGGNLMYILPGCYEIQYSVNAHPCAPNAICTPSTCIARIQISQQPLPCFEIQNEVCWDGSAGRTITPFICSPAYPAAPVPQVVRSWSISSGPGTINPTTGVVTITGTGVITVCLTESITQAACGALASHVCSEQVCQTISVGSGMNIESCFDIDPTEPCINSAVTITVRGAKPLPFVGTFTYSGPGGTLTPASGKPDQTTGIITFTPTACGQHTLTYTVQDTLACTSVCTRVINTDRTIPTITPPANTTVECGPTNAATLATWLSSATATDNCPNVGTIGRRVFNDSTGCGGTKCTTYEFSVADACGNVDTAYARFCIMDRTGPVLTAPRNLVIECGPSMFLHLDTFRVRYGGSTASDVCGGSVNLKDSLAITASLCCETATMNYFVIATDQCGNRSSMMSTITIQDTRTPVWQIKPQSDSVACDTARGLQTDYYQDWLNTNGGGIAGDSCCPFINYTRTLLGTRTLLCGAACVNSWSETWIFRAADECGNFDQDTATIAFLDSKGPENILPPKDTTVACQLDTTAALNDWLTRMRSTSNWRDECCSVNAVTATRMNRTNTCGGSWFANYMFQSTDLCGNVSKQVFARFTVIDTLPPVITTPAFDTVVVCDGVDQRARLDNWLRGTARMIATDACGSAIRVEKSLYQSLDTCSNGAARFVYLFKVIDACNNYVLDTAEYIIRDNIAPIWTRNPVDTVINCGPFSGFAFTGWLNRNGGGIATDACGTVTITNNFRELNFVCTGGTGTALVTFTATDGCGNVSTRQANVTIRDASPPVWTLMPQDLIIECDGNRDPRSAIASWLKGAGNGVATDTCISFINYTNNFVGLMGGCHYNTGSATVTFRATDACGNSATAVALVRVRDTFPPDIISPAKDTTVFCSLPGSPSNITAARTVWLQAMGRAVSIDRCDGKRRPAIAPVAPSPNDTLTTLMRYINPAPCNGNINLGTWTYMFQFRDSCGNLSAATIANFTVRDTAPPVWNSTYALDTVVDCDRFGNPNGLANWLAYRTNPSVNVLADPCNGTVRIEHDLVRRYDLCSNTDSSVYRFTAFDCSGNSSTREAIFKIRDITAPILSGGRNDTVSCEVYAAGNDDELIHWLDSFAYISAVDACSDVIEWRHNFTQANWRFMCGATRCIDVTFSATDDCGNLSQQVQTFCIVDTTMPIFLNCGRPPIVVAAETFHCDAYVNFELPLATDNCSGVQITQIDKTGLSTGDRFPVGTTVLIWEARDSCNNVDTCSLKIIVNDYWDLPKIVCPSAKTFVAPIDSCGKTLTVADSIFPVSVTDNCPNTVVTYTIKDKTNTIIKKGFGDASGQFFPVGVDTLTYCVYDQPILLISEVTQQLGNPVGGMINIGRTNPVPPFITTDLIDGDYIEIANYGANIIDLTCLSVEIVGPAGSICNYTIAPEFPLMPMHFLAPGQVLTLHVGSGVDNPVALFFNMNCTQAAWNDQRAYILRLYDKVIDVVATNGFNPVGTGTIAKVTTADWKGVTDPHVCRGSYYRTSGCDMNMSTDWERAESCNKATIGSWNPGHEFAKSNNDTVSLQSLPPHPPVCCSVPITILDQQAPVCGIFDTLPTRSTGYGGATNLGVAFNQGVCFTSSITVPTNCIVDGLRILNLTGSSSQNLGDWEVTLVSPKGTRVKLWENVCGSSTSFNLNIAEKAACAVPTSSITSAPCVPNFGNGGFFAPVESFGKFFHEQGMGVWRLEIEDNTCSSSPITNLLTNWTLQLFCVKPLVTRDTMITAAPYQCHRWFNFFNPQIFDNCPMGTMKLTYVTRCTVARTGVVTTVLGPVTKDVIPGSCDSLFLPIGTTTLTYTLTDMSGNVGTCSYNVILKDVTPPQVLCPKDINLQAEDGDCGKFYNFTVMAMDSCGVDTFWSNPPSGHFFSIGTTRTCIYGIDKSGNIDSCCFNVTVSPFIPGSSDLTCNDQVNLSLDQNCQGKLGADDILEGGQYWCYNDYEIIIEDYNGVRHINLFTIADVGHCYKVTIRDPRTGNSCWGKVCIEDKQAPQILCPRDTIVSCIADIDPDYLGYARLTTCEPNGVDWNWHDDVTDSTECSVYVSIITRTWIATDDQGNSDTCKQKIYIKRLDLADIVFPRNFDDLDLPHLECSEKRINKDLSAHILPSSQGCVDGYLLDSVYWLSRPADPNTYPRRRPRSLGWNYLETGKYIGHPSPYTIYHDAHPDYITSGQCWPANRHPLWNGTGFPTITGLDVSTRGKCAISIKYDDDVYDICEDGIEILRYWKIRNMCLPVIAGVNPIEHIQIIKVLDKKAPTIVYPDSIVVNSSPWECKGLWDVAEPWMEDACSDSITYSVRTWAGSARLLPNGKWVVSNLPIGSHRAEIVAKDNCGNTAIKKLVVRVIDGVPPIAVCQQHVVVGLTGGTSPGENITKIFASSLDDGSYDNCNPHVYFKVIRMEELRGTLNGDLRISPNDNKVSCDGLNGDDWTDPIQFPGNQIAFDDYTKFCCNDVGQKIMLVFRVFDVDPGPGPVFPNRMGRSGPNLQFVGDLFGHFSDCMVEVEVQDKVQPTLVPPPNIVVSCMFWYDFEKLRDPLDPTFGRVVSDLTDRAKVKTVDMVCQRYCAPNTLHNYPGPSPGATPPNLPAPNIACNYFNTLFNPAHPDEKYEMVWGFDGYALGGCNVTVSVTPNDDNVKCGQGVLTRTFTVRTAGGATLSRQQTIWIVDCDPFYVNNSDFCDPNDDIDWPTCISPTLPGRVEIDGCGADLSPDNPRLGRPRVMNNADDNCALIAIEYKDEVFTVEPDACLKVIRTWTVIDWCQYDPSRNILTGKWTYQQIIKVRDNDDPIVTASVGDCEPATLNTTDAKCYGHIKLGASATDNCSPLDWLFWEHKIDLYNDGVGVHSGYDFVTGALTKIQFDNGETPQFHDNIYADNPNNPFAADGTYPVGVHKIRWIVEDGCGNIGVSDVLFQVKDCKAPTPYCLTGIITVPMPSSKCVTIWAKDLDRGSFDNCTPQSALKFYFTQGDTSSRSKTICCDDFLAAGVGDELILDVEMWVEDEEGNADYCKAQIIIQDNQDLCPDNIDAGRIVGELKTQKNEHSTPTLMQLYRNSSMIKERQGSPYLFGELPLNSSYTVRPLRNDNHINGVTTADIVKIQKHLLGTEEISDSYKLIAADVNNSGSVTAADMAEIRKLILGINAEFTKVQSWTFVPTAYQFADPSNPYKAPRSIDVTFGNSEMSKNADFVAIKMGDLNGNAIANFNSKVQSRSSEYLNLNVKQQILKTGEDYRMEVKASDFKDIIGYQFSLTFDSQVLLFDGFESGKLEVDATHFGLSKISEGILTTSWHHKTAQTYSSDDVLFVLKFKVLANADNSQIMTITDDLTYAEAYDENLNPRQIKLSVKSDQELTDASIFELYQNQPNPFDKETVISYRLPKAAAAKMTIYDAAGKVVRIYDINGLKGLNLLKINRSELQSSSSVLFYQLDAHTYTATKRMILINKQ